MAAAADAIFDVVRGICTIASTSIVLNTVKDTWFELYTDECPTCMGHGTMTCPYCQGSKTLRSRPAQICKAEVSSGRKKKSKKVDKIVQMVGENRSCWYCGDVTEYDFDFDNRTQDDTQALRVQENLNAAQAGANVLPFTWAPTAGTVACPDCQGSRVVHRHTPNLERFCNLRRDLFARIRDRAGMLWLGADARPPQVQFWYLEYPAPQPKMPDEVINAKRPIHFILQQPVSEDEDNKDSFSNQDAYNPEDFLLPYFDEDADVPVGESWP